jgi:dienelactone hydrolase
MDELKALGKENSAAAIHLLEEAHPTIQSPIEQFELIFFELSPRYAANGRFEECLKLLKNGQDLGLFYPIGPGDPPFPELVSHLSNLAGFDAFLRENDRRMKWAQKSAATEYYVQLPSKYSSRNSYPLFLVLHGGWGHIPGLVENWQSSVLQSDYIVAYLQGIQVRGPHTRSYAEGDLSNIVQVFREILKKYSVDTSRITIGGQSAGAGRAATLAFEELIPARGLILAFPSMSGFPDETIQKAAARGVRVSIMTGENDPRIELQKAIAVHFDQEDLPNRFIVSSETGHEFPDDFPRQLNLSLEYIFRNSR